MNWRAVLLPIALGALLQSGFAVAQQAPPGQPRLEGFYKMAPKIGEQLPDITIADDQGNPVNVRELAREHYTVLVLGCLT